jgi:hypothetical protein
MDLGPMDWTVVGIVVVISIVTIAICHRLWLRKFSPLRIFAAYDAVVPSIIPS